MCAARFLALVAQIGPPFFAPVLGVAGLGIAWRIASGLLGVPAIVGEVIVVLSFALFVAVGALFFIKILWYPASLKALWSNNTAILFLPLVPTSMLLLSIGARPHDAAFSTVLWQFAAPLNLILAVVIVGRWLFDDHQHADLSPAWMFPVVGNGVVPIAGVPLGFINVGWAFLAIGFVLWVITFVLLFSRLLLGDALAKAARPTLLILISPPATFYIAYSELTGARIDLFAYSMIYFSLFLLAVFLVNGKWLINAPFSIASWSLTFPMAALTIAMLLFFRSTGWVMAQWAAAALLMLTSVFVVSVLSLGVKATIQALCAPTEER